MTRFFFHLQDRGRRVPDEEGVELPDADSAHRHALQSARLILCDQVVQGRIDMRRAIQVEDENGRSVAHLPFHAALSIDG